MFQTIRNRIKTFTELQPRPIREIVTNSNSNRKQVTSQNPPGWKLSFASPQNFLDPHSILNTRDYDFRRYKSEAYPREGEWNREEEGRD